MTRDIVPTSKQLPVHRQPVIRLEPQRKGAQLGAFAPALLALCVVIFVLVAAARIGAGPVPSTLLGMLAGLPLALLLLSVAERGRQ